ncbi:MAG: hypothetical protein ABSA30_03310 [Candidatus Aminicenantales bacterium]|jgi:hypothetical protein
MKKTILGLVLLAAVLLTATAQMRRGEAAIFFRDGRVIFDQVTGIVTSNLIVQTPGNGQFPMRDVWLINYEENRWDYPGERARMIAGEDAIFLRNGNAASGQIVNFLSEHEAGPGRPWGYKLRKDGRTTIYIPSNISRIYYSKDVPAAFTRNQNPNLAAADNPVIGVYNTIGNSPAIEMQLAVNGTARWTMINGGGVMLGTWRFNRGDTAIVVVRLSSGAGVVEMTFGRDANDLVGLSYDKRAYGQLRFRK